MVLDDHGQDRGDALGLVLTLALAGEGRVRRLICLRVLTLSSNNNNSSISRSSISFIKMTYFKISPHSGSK